MSVDPQPNERPAPRSTAPSDSSPTTTDALGPVSGDYREPTPNRPSTARRAGLAIREVAETLIVAAIIFFLVRSLVLNFRVDGESMYPNLHNDDMLLVNRVTYWHFDLNGVLDALPFIEREGENIVYPFSPPERGDIVVFTPPTNSNKPYIKRIIGLPGDTVEIRDNKIFINGEELEEGYPLGGPTNCNQSVCRPWIVPEGFVFVMGDNRDDSSDSRLSGFGPVSIDMIIGKAWFTYWPSDRIGLVPHYEYSIDKGD